MYLHTSGQNHSRSLGTDLVREFLLMIRFDYTQSQCAATVSYICAQAIMTISKTGLATGLLSTAVHTAALPYLRCHFPKNESQLFFALLFSMLHSQRQRSRMTFRHTHTVREQYSISWTKPGIHSTHTCT